MLNQIADADALDTTTINDAYYQDQETRSQDTFNAGPYATNANAISQATCTQDNTQADQQMQQTDAGADQQRVQRISNAEAAWVQQLGGLDKQLASDWATAQTDFAQAQATAAIAAATAVAQGEQGYLDADAQATRTQAQYDAGAAQTLAGATATENANFAQAAANNANAQSLAGTIAQQTYDVGLNTDHVTAMTAAYNGDPNHTPLEQYQMAVAQADLAQATADASATVAEANQLYAPVTSVDSIQAQAIRDASIAAATREAAANHTDAYSEASDESQLTVNQDAADAALYIAQITAVANLPAGAAAVEQAADANYANDVQARDQQLAKDGTQRAQDDVAGLESYNAGQISSDQYHSDLTADGQKQASDDQQAETTFNTAIAQDAQQEQTDLGPVREEYVDEIYGARVTYVTQSNQAQERYAQSEADADMLLTTKMASSDYQNQQATISANLTQSQAQESDQATLEANLAGDSVADATGRAAAEAAYQVATANQQAAAAASAATAAPGNTNLEFAAALAAAQAAWVASLATPAAGQSQSPYVQYQSAEAQAEAISESLQAFATATLDNAQAGAAATYNLAAAYQDEVRTVALEQVEDGTDQTSLSNPDGSDQSELQSQDQLSLKTAQNDQQQAEDYLTADIAYNNKVEGYDEQAASDSSYNPAPDLAAALAARDQQIATADYNWRSRAAADELTLALAEAQHDQAATTGQATAEEQYSAGVALAQAAEDQTNARVEAQNMLDQTNADNAQLTGDATANAGFQTAQAAADVAAVNAMQSSLTSLPPSAVTWAQFQVQQTQAEQTAWSSTLDTDYLSTQQQTAAAYTAYAQAEFTAYTSAANDEAVQNYNNAVYAAGQTQQEADTLAGDEAMFDTQLANQADTERVADMNADQTYADALASDTQNGTSSYGDYENWQSVTDPSTGSAATTYQDQYVAFDAERRTDMAEEGLTFEQNLTGNAESTAAHIASDQSGYDNTVASADYVAGASSPSGLEDTVATLENNYEDAYSSATANAVSNLASANPSASWATVANEDAAAEQTQSASDIQQANANYQTDLSNAATADADNLASGQADRSAWISDLGTSDQQLLSTAQTTVASAAVGGDPSQVTAPADLTPPTPDIGPLPALPVTPAQALAANSTPLGTGYLASYGISAGYGITQYNIESWGDHGVFSASSPTSDWSNPGVIAAPQSYDVLSSFVAREGSLPVFAGGGAGQSNPFSFGAGGAFTYQYGASLGSWYNVFVNPSVNADAFVQNVSSPSPTAPSPIASAVQQEQTSVDNLSAAAGTGMDQFTSGQGATPAVIDASTGATTVPAGAGNAELDVAGLPAANSSGAAGPVQQEVADNLAAPPTSPIAAENITVVIHTTQAENAPPAVADASDTAIFDRQLALAKSYLAQINSQLQQIGAQLDALPQGAQATVDDASMGAIEDDLSSYYSALDAAFSATVRGHLSSDRIHAVETMPTAPGGLQLKPFQYDALAQDDRELGALLAGRTAAWNTAVNVVQTAKDVCDDTALAISLCTGAEVVVQIGRAAVQQAAAAGTRAAAAKAAAWTVVKLSAKPAAIVGGTFAATLGVDAAAKAAGASPQTRAEISLAMVVVGAILLHRRTGPAAEVAAEAEQAPAAAAAESEPRGPEPPQEPPEQTPGQSAQPNQIPASVPKNNLTGQALQDVQQVQQELLNIRDQAVANIKNGTATGPGKWIQKIKGMSTSDPEYAKTFGNAVDQEAQALIKAQQVAGNLPKNMVVNRGVGNINKDLPNSYNGLRPDVRLPLGNGREAVFDFTTVGQAGALDGHAGPYADFDFVDYAADLPYRR